MYIKLITPDSPNDPIYFRTLKACEDFKMILKASNCDVPWNEPELIPFTGISKEERWFWIKGKHIYDEPKALADGYLFWALNLDIKHDRDNDGSKRKYIDDAIDNVMRRYASTLRDVGYSDDEIDQELSNMPDEKIALTTLWLDTTE